MKEKVLSFLILLLVSFGLNAQEIGANYNENIDYPITEIDMLRHANITWVRGFVNISNHFLVNTGGVITGVKEDVIKNHIPTLKFLQAKKALGDQVKFILSLKITFGDYTDVVPKEGTQEREYVFQAAKLLLDTYGMGENIDILVMGNEPMYENIITPFTSSTNEDAGDYENFLNEFADRLAQWKKDEGWTFEVFGGSLNRVSELTDRKTIKAVVNVVNSNPNVDGIDLHIHAQYVQQAENDLKRIREEFKVTKKIISTEFSMVRALNPHVADQLGSWGTRNGYPSTMKIYEYLNMAAEKASAGNPVSPNEFADLFNSFTWYPKNWYATFYEKFKKYDTYAITGRFSAVPGGSRAVYTATTEMWELGSIYMSRYLGIDENGHHNPSLLLYPDFLAAQNSIPVSSFIEGQREIFLQLSETAASSAKKVVVSTEGENDIVRNLIEESDYIVIEGLKPGKMYTLTLLKADDSILWTRGMRTKVKIGDFPLLKYKKAGNYQLIQVLNLPDDVVSLEYQLDGDEIEMVNENLDGSVLSAKITYGDGSVEVISTNID